MVHRIFFVVLVVGLAFNFVSFAQTKKKSTPPITKASSPLTEEDYGVYSALFKELFGNKTIVLESEVAGCTSIGNNKEGETSWQKSLDALPAKLKKLQAKTVADFKSKSRLCRTLEGRFPASVKMISKAERRVIFSGKDMRKAWAAFNKKYVGTGGYAIVSNVGFNDDRTQALVNISNKCGEKCGDEQFILLSKMNGSWSVIGMHTVWQL